MEIETGREKKQASALVLEQHETEIYSWHYEKMGKKISSECNWFYSKKSGTEPNHCLIKLDHNPILNTVWNGNFLKSTPNIWIRLGVKKKIIHSFFFYYYD